MSTQIFVASTAFGLATVVAAIEDDCWPTPDRRILITCNNAAFPEATGGLLDTPGVDKLLGHFDHVYDYNAAIAPQHPSIWRPAAAELPMLQRFFAATWQVPADEDVILVVESIHVPPARTLCQIFPDARIDVYADGLMTYGPTRDGLFTHVGFRVDRLLHLDLVPGVEPLVLREWRVKPLPISTDRFRDVISRMAAEAPTMITTAAPGTVAVLLGQYLSDAGILTAEEELELHRDLIRGAVRAGFTKLIFKPHPTAAETDYDRLLADAAEAGRRAGGAPRARSGRDLVLACRDRAGRRLLLHRPGDRVRPLPAARGPDRDRAVARAGPAVREQQPDPGHHRPRRPARAGDVPARPGRAPGSTARSASAGSCRWSATACRRVGCPSCARSRSGC